MSLNIITADALSFTLTQDEVKRIPLLAKMSEDCAGEVSEEIAVTVESGPLKNVLAWINKKEEDKFWPSYEKHDIFAILMASDYFDMDDLLKEGAKYVADFTKGMTVEQLREYYEKEDDFTDEERAEIERENKWMENL
ncbi:E3 ubiquitine ligase SCF complex Skp1 subunit [Cedratvirus Zaza IHUMI]|uniref:E3 ubiquitine ligase SCF complex Skp1 subunit n=1 Tax=Cedratvirus Zaza IHUMI TaxID=2126979 RepID=A0A2R8FE69_9VIRU|nr:E3 ubiquitin ligase SCF complex [Cedratvirus plubellavi]SPN79266.1 E3 ubiquitine ligase SCF complex Skp1 subunit [Cedratvirus Zaza IHUMI]